MSRQRRAFESVLLATLVVLVLVAVGLGVFGEWRDRGRAADARTADDARQTMLLDRFDEAIEDLEALQLAELTGDVTALRREVREIRARDGPRRRQGRASQPSDTASSEEPAPPANDPERPPTGRQDRRQPRDRGEPDDREPSEEPSDEPEPGPIRGTVCRLVNICDDP